MTLDAPAAMALAMSPVCLTPPSAMIGMPLLSASLAQSMIAVNCGTPTPATTRVVQMTSRADADLHAVDARIDQI